MDIIVTFAQNITREILEEVLPYMNIYRDEETTGIHYGWDIKGEDSGAVAMTDIVNEETQSEMPVEDGLTDVPDTTDDLPGNQEDAETTVPDVDVGNVGDSDIPPVVTDIPIDNNE